MGLEKARNVDATEVERLFSEASKGEKEGEEERDKGRNNFISTQQTFFQKTWVLGIFNKGILNLVTLEIISKMKTKSLERGFLRVGFKKNSISNCSWE